MTTSKTSEDSVPLSTITLSYRPFRASFQPPISSGSLLVNATVDYDERGWFQPLVGRYLRYQPILATLLRAPRVHQSDSYFNCTGKVFAFSLSLSLSLRRKFIKAPAIHARPSMKLAQEAGNWLMSHANESRVFRPTTRTHRRGNS